MDLVIPFHFSVFLISINLEKWKGAILHPIEGCDLKKDVS